MSRTHRVSGVSTLNIMSRKFGWKGQFSGDKYFKEIVNMHKKLLLAYSPFLRGREEGLPIQKKVFCSS